MLYLCGACKTGDHENCERGHPAHHGQFGGSSCICNCCGRSQKEMERQSKEDFKKLFENLDGLENPRRGVE